MKLLFFPADNLQALKIPLLTALTSGASVKTHSRKQAAVAALSHVGTRWPRLRFCSNVSLFVRRLRAHRWATSATFLGINSPSDSGDEREPLIPGACLSLERSSGSGILNHNGLKPRLQPASSASFPVSIWMLQEVGFLLS